MRLYANELYGGWYKWIWCSLGTQFFNQDWNSCSCGVEFDSNSTWSKGKCANASFEHGGLASSARKWSRNWKDELQQDLPKFSQNLKIIEKGSCLNLLKGKHVSNFYQPYEELEYNSIEDDDDQSKMVV